MGKLTNLQFLLVALFYVISCSAPQKNDQEQNRKEVDQAEATEKATNDPESNLIHVNLATKEELTSIEGISNELADQIADMRPFFGMNSLDSLLSSLLSNEKRASVYQQLFVKLNLNSATESEFKMIPGVGDKMAHEFEEYRPYVSIEQFRREIRKYVDEDEVARYEKYVFVPVNLNTASDEEILSIPGVGDRMLHEFKEYRPYESIEQFRREIGKYVDDKELARLERFVTL